MNDKDDIIYKMLTGGDLRSIGKANEVLGLLLKEPNLFRVVFHFMFASDPIVRMRSADVIQKVSVIHPELLHPFKKQLIKSLPEITQQEVRWHVAQLLSYLKFNKSEMSIVINVLNDWLDNDKSNIVKVCCIQTLSDLSKQNPQLKIKVVKKIKELIKIGSPAVLSRCKKLLGKLNA